MQTEVGKLNLCQSLENHIGGDELNTTARKTVLVTHWHPRD
jgi:hypothetical protein